MGLGGLLIFLVRARTFQYSFVFTGFFFITDVIYCSPRKTSCDQVIWIQLFLVMTAYKRRYSAISIWIWRFRTIGWDSDWAFRYLGIGLSAVGQNMLKQALPLWHYVSRYVRSGFYLCFAGLKKEKKTKRASSFIQSLILSLTKMLYITQQVNK